MKKEKKNVWVIVAGIIAAVAALVAIATYFKIVPMCNPFMSCEPQFKFTYEGTGKPVYEVAEGLEYSDQGSQAILPFTISVEVLQYSGDQYNGEMDVYSEWSDQNNTKRQEPIGKWDNFRSQFQTPVRISLTPSKLFDYANLPASMNSNTWNTTQLNKGSFDLVVRYIDGTELKRQTITVTHTPWYHEVILDNSVISVNQSINAHVRVVNLGEPSNFNVDVILYDTSTPNLPSLTDGKSWWVDKTWPTKVYVNNAVTDHVIGTNTDYVTAFPIPANRFTAGHTYALVVFAMKQFPYLKFSASSDTWITSTEGWRYRDNPSYTSIFVLK